MWLENTRSTRGSQFKVSALITIMSMEAERTLTRRFSIKQNASVYSKWSHRIPSSIIWSSVASTHFTCVGHICNSFIYWDHRIHSDSKWIARHVDFLYLLFVRHSLRYVQFIMTVKLAKNEKSFRSAISFIQTTQVKLWFTQFNVLGLHNLTSLSKTIFTRKIDSYHLS